MGNREKQKDDSRQESASKPAPGAAVGVSHQPAKQSPGFLNSPNRVNVAMSRAMERLFIVGSTKMWSGKNSQLPLGRALTKIRSLTDAGRAGILSGKQFQGN